MVNEIGKMIKVFWKARGKWSWEPENKEIQLILIRQGPGNEGRVRHVKDLGGRGRTGKETPGEEESGIGYRSPWRRPVDPRVRDIRSWACAS